MKKKNKKFGFTILELLVVIAIIGILSAISLAFLSGVRAKGRDARRLQDMKAVQSALNLYSTDHSGAFPIDSSDPIDGSVGSVGEVLVSGGYINAIPTDPQGGTMTYSYESLNPGTTYTLGFCLETDTVPGYSAGCSNEFTP